MKTKVIGLFIIGAMLAGCGGSGSGSTASSRPVRSPAQAVAQLSSSGINTYLELGEAGNLKSSNFTTGFMNMTSASQKIDQPVRFSASLGNTPAANFIREKAIPIYVYVLTKLELTRVDGDGSNPRKGKENVRLERYHCEGYKIVLHPGNNYSLTTNGVTTVEIREKSQSTLNAGIISISQSSDWKVTGAEGFTKVSTVRLKPFMVVPYGQRYLNPVNFDPAHAVSYAYDKDCVLSSQKDFFKAGPSGPATNAPKGPN